MSTFYQIVKRQDCDGSWIGFFADYDEIYNSHDDALKRAEELATAQIQRYPDGYLQMYYREENDKTYIELFNTQTKDLEMEFHIKELTLT